MMRNEDLYCKIYVDARSSTQLLAETIVLLTMGKIEGWTITAPCMEIDLEENEDRKAPYPRDGRDYFLYFPYYLDVWPASDSSRDQYVRSISALLEEFWSKGIDAVAACDFEDELSKKGGYQIPPSD